MKNMKQEIVAFIGLRRSGKDTAAEALVAEGWKLVKFADALKGMLRCYLDFVGIPPTISEKMIEGELKEVPSPALQGKSPRWAMQSLGTEWGRNLIGDNLWVDATVAKAKQYARTVISDCRFPNEAEAVRSQGGTIIRIIRDGLTVDSHPSESLIEGLTADFTIVNDGTVDDLKTKVLDLVNNHL